MTGATRFSLGVDYWPRSSAVAMWQRFDAGEVREDFARIAGLGLDTVRFFLRWDDFQPRADAVDPVMLERLETVVGLAAGAGLATVPTLCCGHMMGVNWLPAWALDRRAPRGPYRTISGGAESPLAAGDLYAGRLLDAQVVLARAVGARLREHPAVKAWDIGHQFSNVREPVRGKVSTGDHGAESAADPVVAEWSRRLTAALHETSSIAVTAGAHGGDVLEDRDVRLAPLCAPLAFASMQGSNVTSFIARNRLDPEVIPFLAMVAAAFSYQPVLITGFGNPTCPADKFSALERFPRRGEPPELAISPDDSVFATYPCLTEHENAVYCGEVLERLHADGRLGAYWWCWADYPAELAAQPPFDEAPHATTFGIVRADGSEKPVAAALAAFARRAAHGRGAERHADDLEHLLLPHAADQREDAVRSVPRFRRPTTQGETMNETGGLRASERSTRRAQTIRELFASDRIRTQALERIFVEGDGNDFRNTEFFTFHADKISSVSVYFGATYNNGALISDEAPTKGATTTDV